MLLKYLCCPHDKINLSIDKQSEENSLIIERILLDDEKTNTILKEAIEIIELSLSQKEDIEEILADRKTFERKDTTTIIIEYVKNTLLKKMLLMFDFEDVSTKETSFLCLIIIKTE
ncbi:hypothetical protein KK421_00380 [Clostridioides difficile]|nr:hypothetical protein [Clostridioides difficile]